MQITPVNNIAFKSFLPPESKVGKDDFTRDYWEEFSKECAENSQQKEELDNLLHLLMKNGDNNILALETTKDMKNLFQHNYYFRLYANNEDLIADRKGKYQHNTVQDRCLTQEVWIQPTHGIYSKGNFVVLGNDYLNIGDKREGTFFKPSITDALLYCLEKIVRDPQKRMFDLKNIEPSKYLKQFRAKV